MSFISEKTVWAIKVVIEATPEQADVIAGALCPDHDHHGYCPVPWTTILCRLDDLDAEERAAWSESFEDDRERARQKGEAGA